MSVFVPLTTCFTFQIESNSRKELHFFVQVVVAPVIKQSFCSSLVLFCRLVTHVLEGEKYGSSFQKPMSWSSLLVTLWLTLIKHRQRNECSTLTTLGTPM